MMITGDVLAVIVSVITILAAILAAFNSIMKRNAALDRNDELYRFKLEKIESDVVNVQLKIENLDKRWANQNVLNATISENLKNILRELHELKEMKNKGGL